MTAVAAPHADPLAFARRTLEGEHLRDWRAGRGRAIVHLIHAWGGGVESHATELARRQVEAGAAAVVAVIAGLSVVRVVFRADCPNLVFDLARPADLAAFRHIVAADGEATLHMHHVIGLDVAHVHALMESFAERCLTLHDFYFVTPQINLRDSSGKACKVRPSEECDRCVAALKPPGPFIKPVAAHRAAMAKIAASARKVFTPSYAAQALLARGLGPLPIIVAPHHDEGPIASPRPVTSGGRTVVTIGAFNPDKGALVLADVIRDAGARRLPLHFVIAGKATWAKPPPNVTVLGPYTPGEAAAVLARAAGQIAFLPSIVPESYMFSLSECVRAGYFPVVFDLGAQAERVRDLGWGHILPLGTSPAAIGDLLSKIEIPSIDSSRVEAWLHRDRLGPLEYYD